MHNSTNQLKGTLTDTHKHGGGAVRPYYYGGKAVERGIDNGGGCYYCLYH